MSRSLLLRGVAAGALSLSAAFSFAQEALPPIDVGAFASSPSTDKGSLTAPPVAEQRRRLLQTAGSVAFVDAATPEMETRHVADLRDALKDVPGVFVDTRYGQELRLSMRGSNLTRDYHLRGFELLQDGVPMNYADGGGDFYEIDPKYFRSIEVYKGGNALTFGSSTLGGAINFVSPTAHTAIAPNMASIDGGSFGSVRGQTQVSRVLGDFDFLVNGTFTASDGFRQHSQSDYKQINGNFGYRFSNDIETRFYFGVYDVHQQLPGTLTLSDARSNPSLATSPYIAGAGPNGFGANQARNVMNQRISNKTTLQTDIGRIDVDSWFVHNYLYHPIFVVIEQEGETWGFSPKLTTQLEIAGHKDELVVGGRIWGGGSTDNWFVNYNGMKLNPGGGSWTNWVAMSNPGSDPRIRNNRMTSLNLEAFFENRFYVTPELAMLLGAKIFSDDRRYSVIGGIPFEPLANHSEQNYRGIVPKVGLMFEPQKDLQFFAAFTGSRDVPDFVDLTQGFFPPTAGSNFTPLAAQKAWTGEIGSRGKWDRFAWDVTYYHSELQDELLKFNANPGIGIPATTFNAKRTMHQGVELAASVDLLRDVTAPGAGDLLKLSQVWTWNDFRFVGDVNYGDNPLAGIPRHVLRTTLAYSRPDGLYVAPAVDWVPEGSYVDYMHTLQTPGYLLVGAQAGMKLPYGFSIYVDARNLTDRHYISDVTTIIDARGSTPAAFYPGYGRSVFAGLKWAF
ncbi:MULTISPECIES: TonB-dependent receptor family protein [Methylosinus]|uniref:TonB-dependent receptor n=1 Tax=Methylosinus trichosporium (strain ATCC 35070 / NCIMB 11131 / UNIQEM 75 / OB3b) TaxID=595536 RepID=A0A2D2D034_METT3|nr:MULTISPECIES: TonB-dependent receptor [Methylosinus]ATQ68350.1 TonB-dependent receptor [Methylosinus trichosporium OB3b]OBS50912.1 TonB-dependent receptor [Methylosinus sp. 3S-1]